MFRSRTALLAVATGFTFIVVPPFVFSVFVQQYWGLDALQTGLLLLPMGPAVRSSHRLYGASSSGSAFRLPIVGGQILMAASFLALALVPEDVPVWTLSLLTVPPE